MWKFYASIEFEILVISLNLKIQWFCGICWISSNLWNLKLEWFYRIYGSDGPWVTPGNGRRLTDNCRKLDAATHCSGVCSHAWHDVTCWTIDHMELIIIISDEDEDGDRITVRSDEDVTAMMSFVSNDFTVEKLNSIKVSCNMLNIVYCKNSRRL